jgi:two-component system, NarL family, response regulator DesR
MRRALAGCLEEHGLMVCSEVGDDRALIEMAKGTRPDLCLIDADLPDDSVRAAAQLRVTLPETAVLFLGGSATGGDVARAIRARAAGYLPRNVVCSELARAVASVARGEGTLPLGFVALSPRGRVALTPREVQVLGMLTRGANAGEIAETLAISRVTARRHCGEVRRKLAATDRRLADALARPAS